MLNAISIIFGLLVAFSVLIAIWAALIFLVVKFLCKKNLVVGNFLYLAASYPCFFIFSGGPIGIIFPLPLIISILFWVFLGSSGGIFPVPLFFFHNAYYFLILDVLSIIWWLFVSRFLRRKWQM